VINRGNARQQVFRDPEDYEEFVGLLGLAARRVDVPLLAYCLMPNHWHLVLWPARSRDLSCYMHWLTSTHVRRTHMRRGTRGLGHIYQERYRTVPVKGESQFLMLCRYVERNPLAAGLVDRAELWPYCSLSCRMTQEGHRLLSQWPVARPENWLALVNANSS
jgi:putative transposase